MAGYAFLADYARWEMAGQKMKLQAALMAFFYLIMVLVKAYISTILVLNSKISLFCIQSATKYLEQTYGLEQKVTKKTF